jgi:hypothetical protein
MRFVLALSMAILSARIMPCADAQSLLVETVSMTAGREAVRVSVQDVDLQTGAVSHARQLPGACALGPLLYSGPDAPILAGTAMSRTATERPGPASWTFINVLRAYPAAPLRLIPCMNEWRMSPACLLADGDAVSMGWRMQEGYGLRGCIRHRSLTAHEEPPSAAIQFGGRPLAVVAVGERRLAVICEDDISQSSIVRLIDLNSGKLIGAPIELKDAKAISPLPPAGLALMPESNLLLALTCGRVGNGSGLDSASWLHALNPATGQETAPPVELPGVADTGRRCIFADASGCWIATQPPGTEYAYLTRVHAGDGCVKKETQIILGAVAETFLAAPEPNGERIAAASGNRVEIRNKSGDKIAANSFEGPVAVLKWTEDGILAGETGRIHLLSPTDAVATQTVQLQSGWVNDFVCVPRQMAAPESATSDFPPDLDIPRVVLFRGASVGQEVKAISIASESAPGGWTASFDNVKTPWLVMHPPFGRCPGVLYMGVDPARYTPGHPGWGWLKVALPPFAPENVLLGVIPEEQSQIRRILWVWGGDEQPDRVRKDPRHPLYEAAALLSGPPRLFAHAEASGQFQGSLNQYSMVVLTAKAALQGAIPRPVLLDYIVDGGALLFLGSHVADSESAADIVQWLAPMDIEMKLSENVSGKFARTSEHWLTRHWKDFEIRDGCGIHTGEGLSPLVSTADDARQAVFVGGKYGRGRFAVLAAPTPLENEALAADENREFVEDLFEWLAGAGKDAEFQDMDGDGLPDETEDRNQNGAVDPGETDYLVPDTDGDGVPDGEEDANGNGRVDETETSALVADTDGDGIFDGADYTPLPPIDAPFISAVAPASGPAEGGALVMLTGRNFTPDSAVSFGGRTSPRVRLSGSDSLIAEAPPQGNIGPTVDVRVYSPASQEGYLLPEGYCYTERSRIGLAVQTLAAVKAQNDIYEGTLTLSVKNPENAAVNRLVVILAPETPGAIQWRMQKERITSSTILRQSEGRLIIVSAYVRGQLIKEGPIAAVPYAFKPGAAQSIRLKAEFVAATSPNNQTINVDVPELVIPAGGTAGPIANTTPSDTISNN